MENQKDKFTKTDDLKGLGSGQGTSARTALDMTPQANKIASVSNSIPTPNSGGDVVDKAKDAAKGLLEQAKSTAGNVYGSVIDSAASTIEEQKVGFTGGLTSVADKLRRVSGTISEGDGKNGVTEYAARYTETAAQKLEEAAHYFEKTDLRRIARDVESYARSNPAIFLAGAFAVGVLAARFIKSSSPPSTRSAAAGANSHSGSASNGKWDNSGSGTSARAM